MNGKTIAEMQESGPGPDARTAALRPERIS